MSSKGFSLKILNKNLSLVNILSRLVFDKTDNVSENVKLVPLGKVPEHAETSREVPGLSGRFEQSAARATVLHVADFNP